MSPDGNEHAVIFKSISESENEGKDVYYETLRSAGFQVTLVPVLEFEFVNLDELSCKIKNPHDYAGIIFTSPRCVAGFELSVKRGDDPTVVEKWKSRKHFVVGEKTAALAENLGFVVDGREAGNGDKLAEIISKDKYEKPFLYPIGSLTQKNFKMKLKESNINVDDVMIYQTKPHSELESNITKIKTQLTNNPVYFIYFSPSGIHFSLPILRQLQFDLTNIKFVAIGPTTEAALVENGLQVARTATKPNPQAVLDAVLSLKKYSLE